MGDWRRFCLRRESQFQTMTLVTTSHHQALQRHQELLEETGRKLPDHLEEPPEEMVRKPLDQEEELPEETVKRPPDQEEEPLEETVRRPPDQDKTIVPQRKSTEAVPLLFMEAAAL